MSELIKANAYANQPLEMSFYRTSDGKGIDFVLDAGSQLVTVEIKATQSVSSSDFKHTKSFISEQPNRVKQGIVLPFGESDEVPLWAMPISSAFTSN